MNDEKEKTSVDNIEPANPDSLERQTPEADAPVEKTSSRASASEEKTPEGKAPEEKASRRKHRLPGGIRIPLKVLMWIVIVILLVPVALYIPPVQTAVKNLACRIVKDKTGMDIKVDYFRLKFPLDVSLQGVSIVEATGDTMVRAREAIADIKLLPLLALDVKVKRLQLNDGYYRMVSPDSSMIMKIKAGFLEVDSKSSVSISKSDINLNKATLKDGDVSLYMNVWKQKPTPEDTTSTPFLIKVNDLDIERIRFAMSMLPTIDTLTVDARKMALKKGVIDLRTSNITAQSLTLDGGDVKYLAPTPEYVAAHPAPVDSTATQSAPMTILGENVGISNVSVIYAIKGAEPLPGFDPNYISLTDVNITLKNFYNQATSLRLPVTSISAAERSGLKIVSGEGLVAMTEAGLDISNLNVKTPYSDITATAGLPFALMELKPEAPVNVNVTASIGMSDIDAFMPDFAKYTSKLPGSPLNAKILAEGRLDDVAIKNLDVAIPGVFSMRASGNAANALDVKNMVAEVTIDGEVSNPSPISRFMEGNLPVDIPPLKLSGKASVNRSNYAADLRLATPHGSVLADGHVGLNSERYLADVDVNNLNVAKFMPEYGIGVVDARLHAEGAGFNPTKPGAKTSIILDASRVDYTGKTLRDISLEGTLADSNFSINLDSPNPDLNLTADLTGSLQPDLYCVEGIVKIFNADLQAIGLSKTPNSGKADLRLDITAQPEKWLYDATLEFDAIDWELEDMAINIPDGVRAYFIADANDVHCNIATRGTDIMFDSPQGLQSVVEKFTAAMTVVDKQVAEKNLDMETLQAALPGFKLKARVNGNGLLRDILTEKGFGVDSVAVNLVNDSLIYGDVYALGVTSGSMMLDTITLDIKERGKMMNYHAHLGNAPGTLDEFAKVNLSGYLGANRVSAYLTQQNLAGKAGYRFGFTGSLNNDSIVSLHFTPLNATIAYMPWKFNDDNHVDYEMTTHKIDANLQASSRESSILLQTESSEQLGGDELHLKLANIHIEDFLNMSLTAPPVKATVDGDARVHYDGKVLLGKGDISVKNLIYDKMVVGNFDLGLLAGMGVNGKSAAKADLKINGEQAMSLKAVLAPQGESLEPETVDLSLTRFPLKVANAFLGKDVASLSGVLNGEMNMTGKLAAPVLNGSIACDSVAVFLPIMGSSLKLNNSPLTVTDNVIGFNNFAIYGQNKNPLTINGTVDAKSFSNISFDLDASAQNFQLVNNDRRAKSVLYGKLFLNLTAGIKGPMSHFDVDANLNILGTSDVYYTIPLSASSQLQTMTGTDDVVKFVNFADTAAVQKKDTVAQMMAMRINAGVTITPGTRVTVNLSDNGTDKVELTPSGTLNYYQNFMGDMTLNGQLFLGNGFARYKIPVMGQKTFTFAPQSSVAFTGDIMNPVLNIEATDTQKATVVNSSGNSSLVNFLVTLQASGSLSNPKVVFDLSTNDDLSLQNELQSMSPDQRSTQAMNLLITGRYSGAGMKTTSGPMAENMLYSFLTSQLNSWAAKNIRGVDLSFGVDQYDKTLNGQSSTSTSYSYQVSKSLFNNKFKIVVGGNYTTDASADENFAENLISDVSFEYTLKQTNTLTMLVRLFRHVGYESILEGEVTEMGVGFTMRRRLSNLRRLFTVRWGKRKDPLTPDSVVTVKTDAIPAGRKETIANDTVSDADVSSDGVSSNGVSNQGKEVKP